MVGSIASQTDSLDALVHRLGYNDHSANPVEAVVNAVLFLADPAASPCTTGQELAVDGCYETADGS